MASEVANTVISKVTEPVVDAVGRQIDYARNCNDYISELKTEVEKLRHEKRRVECRVNEAKRGGQKIEPYVDDWLKDAKKFIEEANRFLQHEDRAKEKYCVGLCRPWITRHQMGRKAKKEMLPLAIKLIEKREVFADGVSYREGPKGIGLVKGYVDFESRMSAKKDIMEALADPKVYKIGVYGISGVGKTTLVREIARQAEEKNLFDEVVMATVFPDRNMKEMQGEEIVKKIPNLTRIQEEIADGLDFAFRSQSERRKADELCDRLQDEKKKLVILDNIWAGLELADVGIPSDHCGCKILMVSTSEKVLSSVMDSKKNIQLGILSSDDAQNWFKKMVGLDDVGKNPTLEEYAIQIADRCAGLPNLLITAAKRLKDKGDLSFLTEWKETLKQLSSFDKKDIHADVDLALQLSYNLLGGDEIKSLFLLCGQLRPHAIYVEDLLKYAMGLGLFEKRNTIEDTRVKLLKFISDLKASCLLLEHKIPGTLKMHDIVHDFAVSVACRHHHLFTVASDALRPEWPAIEVLEQCKRITLPYCEIPELPEVLECPNLESFLLFSNDPSLKIPDNLFKQTKELKVLDLTGIHFSALPSSLMCLENLRTLCLDYCVLGDITMVGKLKTLRVLSFGGSDIVQLPREIKKLTELRLLNLKNCRRLGVIPPEILSCLTQLEELNMENSFLQWEVDGQNNQRKNASLNELKHLSNLRTLDIHITNATMLPKGSFFEKLERFRIFIGDGWNSSGEHKTLRTLKLKLNSSNELEKGVKALLKRTEDLYLDELKGVRNSLCELDGQGFPPLKHLHVENSHEIQYIIDAMGMGRCSAFTRLESLFLDNLKNLEKICCGELQLDSFSNLRVLKVGSCDGLKNLFSSSMARALLLVEDISVTDCKIMEEVVTGGTDNDTDRAEAIKFAQLRVLTLESLPQFKSFCSNSKTPSLSQTGQELPATDLQSKETQPENDPDSAIPLFNKRIYCGSFFHSKVKAPSLTEGEQKLPATGVRSKEIVPEIDPEAAMPLFNKKVFFPNLKDLKLSSINNDMIWHDQFSGISSCVPNLTSLIVDGCSSFKCLLSSPMVESLVNLKNLEISNCKMMEKIIYTEESISGKMSGMLLCQLETLRLKDLPNLAEFCRTDLLKCPGLKRLWIDNCSKLSVFTSNSSRTNQATCSEVEIMNSALFDEKVAFPNLEGLTILNMNSLKTIWHNKLHENSFSKLKRLELGKMEELQNVFPSNYIVTQFQNVEFLSMDDCKLLEKVFDLQEATIVKGIDVMVASQLRTLHIENLPNLKCIWNFDAQEILSFQYLQAVSVLNCPNLKSLFPANIARGLHKLSFLWINRCGIVEIISKEEGKQIVPEFEFHQLTFIQLWNLPALKSLYPGKHFSEFPKLKFLDVYECDEIEIFTSESQSVEASSEDQLESIPQQPLFSAEKIIPNLEELSLNGKDVTTLWDGQLKKDLFPNVEVLHLQCFHDESMQFPFDLIRRFNNLDCLFVEDSCFKEIFASDNLVDGENQGKMFSKIQNLCLSFLYNLKQIKLDHVLKILENLEIRRCHSLINLAPSSASFQNLTFLYVWECDNLVNLVTFPTAKSLVQLRRLTIEQCKMMTEVLANEGEDGSNEIIFHKLESLILDCLTNLVSFCPANWTLKFPSLEALTVRQCPKMRAFSQGDLEAPKLRKVETVVGNKKHLQKDLNTTIKKLYEELVGFNGMKYLKLSEFPELEERWPDQLPVSFFNNISLLVVDKCASCSIAVPSNLLPCMNCLEELKVSNCELVEELFGIKQSIADGHVGYLTKLSSLCVTDLPRLRQVWNENYEGILNFKHLKVVKIHNCESLRNIFTPTLVMHLVKLEVIEVKGCPKVQEIIANVVAEEANKIIFPLLSSVTFESLPNLTSFYSGSGTVECPSLKVITVIGCPSTFLSTFIKEEPNATEQATRQQAALEKLSVEWNHKMEEFWHGQCRAEFFGKLKVFELMQFPDNNAVFPSHFLHRLPSLENLVVSDALFEEIVLHGDKIDEENRIGFPTQLKKLKLYKLPKLTLLSKENSQSCLVFQNLETLEVLECSSLKILVPSPVSFQCLKILEVSKCHGLINLITSSTAGSLVQLMRMSVTECEMIEEVIANKENETESEIVFSKLKCLRLHCLPRVTSFYSGTCALMFPSLEELQLTECANMKIISRGDLKMPKLKKKQLEGAAIQQLAEMGYGVGKSKPSITRQLTLDFGNAKAKQGETAAVTGGQPSEDLHVTKNPDVDQVLPTKVETAVKVTVEEQALKSSLTEQGEMNQLAPTEPYAISSDEPDPTHGGKSQIVVPNETHVSLQIQNHHQITKENVSTMPVSTYASPTEITSSNELTSGTACIPPSEMPSTGQFSNKTSHFPAKFESLFASMQDMLKPSSELCSQTASNSITNAELHEFNGESFQNYDFSMDMFKKLLKKNLSEVARSADALQLLTSLKNLKNCPLLNSDQLKIIQYYIENFDSLVAYHTFFEHQIDMSSALKFAIEDKQKRIATLKSLYEGYMGKSGALSITKEELKRRLQEIEEEEDCIRANVEVLYTDLVTTKGELKTDMNVLREAVRQQREAEDKSSKANHSWEKLRSLFS